MSKLEINIRSLISQCEQIIEINKEDWRLKKFIKSLDIMIKELNESNESGVDEEAILKYKSRCKTLKEAINYMEAPSTMDKKINLSDDGDNFIREIKQIHNSRYEANLKKDLFNGKGNATIRRRAGQKISENLDQTIKNYSDIQEKLAEDMLSLTRNLKEQTETANKIIKKDTEVVVKSTKLTEENVDSLGQESHKLQENSKKAWKCWMWIMIAIVMMIFIFMVLFMKIMKKRVIK